MRAEEIRFHRACGSTLSQDGSCPSCRVVPEGQDSGFMWVCPTHKTELLVGMMCQTCRVRYERPA